MDAVTGVDGESVGDEVVLNRGVHLDNIPPLPSYIYIVDTTVTILCIESGQISGAQDDSVGPILECTAKLSSVDGKTEWLVGG